jgi:hypothetical protein
MCDGGGQVQRIGLSHDLSEDMLQRTDQYASA